MAAFTLPAFRASRTFCWMVVLSVVVHTLFLYGIRVATEKPLDPPAVRLSATIAPREVVVVPQAVAREAEPVKPAVKKRVAKPAAKKPTPPEPIAEGPAAVPEPAPDMAPSPMHETVAQPIAEDRAPAPAPSIATELERSGAKLRAPTPIDNPTMPADDVAVAAPPLPEEPLPAIATAPHPIEPIAQDAPRPAGPTVEHTALAPPPPPGASLQPEASAEPAVVPKIPRETPSPPVEVAKAAPSISAQPMPVAPFDPNALPLPTAGEAQYKLRMGVVSGELLLSWNFADGHYRLDSVAQGTGLFAIAGKYVQASEGEIIATGLRPTAFSVERRGRKESAKFNWPENSVQFSGKSGERTDPVSAGTQDMLSLLFQLAFTPPLGDDLTVIVTNGRKLERYAFERAGEESISLEGGTFRTLKIHKQRKGDEDGMEVWLALEHHYLPVKIRVTDKKGSVIEQTLMAMKVLSAKH